LVNLKQLMFSMKNFSFFLTLFSIQLLNVSHLLAQDPILDLRFDDCTAANSAANRPDGELSGDPDCICGVFGSAFYLDGSGESISIADSQAFDLLTFTISFYFQPDRNSGDFVVLSHLEQCNSLLGMSMIYRSGTNQLELELSRDLGRRVLMTADLADNKCWHHIIFERSGGRHTFFVEGERVAEVNSGGLIEFANSGAIVIGSSPCVPAFINPMTGAIDEFRVYDRILNNQEKFNLRRSTNEILSRDTVILIDAVVNVRVTDDCTEFYSWSPQLGIEDPFEGNTGIRPFETTTYYLEFSENNCVSTDSIRIIVVDPDEVTCEDLTLPTAFTPNSDGLNDRFFISNEFIIEELLSFEIFDRSGGTLFRTSSLSDSWDGNFRGEPVNPGVYLYKVEYRCAGEIYLKTGQVMVMR
jgi:gliding motility-associated-like protein